jgi:hypothetical protein
MVRRVGDGHHVVFRVVTIGGQVPRSIRHRQQPVGIVVLIGCDLAVGISRGGPPPAMPVAQGISKRDACPPSDLW